MSTITFEINEGIEIPAADGRENTTAHPFPWATMGDMALAGGTPQFIVPKDYWEGRQGMEGEENTPPKARARIKGTFDRWAAKDKARASLKLTTRYVDDGAVAIWVQKIDPAPAKKTNNNKAPKK